MKDKVKFLIPLGCILIGALFAVLSAMNYEIYSPTRGPMSGFMPLVIGVMLVLVGIADLFRTRNAESAHFEKGNWFFVLCVAITIAASYFIGLLPAGFLFVFFWVKIWTKSTWKVTILTLVVLFVMVVGIFVFWLDIPFSYGLFDQFLQ